MSFNQQSAPWWYANLENTRRYLVDNVEKKDMKAYFQERQVNHSSCLCSGPY